MSSLKLNTSFSFGNVFTSRSTFDLFDIYKNDALLVLTEVDPHNSYEVHIGFTFGFELATIFFHTFNLC